MKLHVTRDYYEAAAAALYNEFHDKVPFSTCLGLALYVENLPVEKPSEYTLRQWKRELRQRTYQHARDSELVPGGWHFNDRWYLGKAIEALVSHWIEHKGSWV